MSRTPDRPAAVTQHPHATTFPIAQLDRRFTAFAVDRLLAWGLLAVVGVVMLLRGGIVGRHELRPARGEQESVGA